MSSASLAPQLNKAGRRHGGRARPGARAEAALHRSGRLLAAKPAAAYLGVPYSTLRDLAFKGELAIVRLGGRDYVERAELDQLIARHTVRRTR